MARILLTGATGLIGRHVLACLAPSHELHALVRRPVDLPGARALAQDHTAPLDEAVLPRDVETVIHLAQSEKYRDFPDAAQDIFDVNVGSTFRLLDWARRAGVRRFVFASSGGIYGHGAGPFREEDPIQPGTEIGFYISSKSSGELLVESYAGCFTVIVLRFFFVYGPGQRESMLVPRLVRSVMDGRPITLQGDDGIRINPVFATDAAAAVAAAASLGESHKINIAGLQSVSMRSLGETIGKVVGRPPVFAASHDQVPRHLLGDTQKMLRLLARPQTDLDRGLGLLVDAMRQTARGAA